MNMIRMNRASRKHPEETELLHFEGILILERVISMPRSVCVTPWRCYIEPCSQLTLMSYHFRTNIVRKAQSRKSSRYSMRAGILHRYLPRSLSNHMETLKCRLVLSCTLLPSLITSRKISYCNRSSVSTLFYS